MVESESAFRDGGRDRSRGSADDTSGDASKDAVDGLEIDMDG